MYFKKQTPTWNVECRKLGMTYRKASNKDIPY